MGGSSDEIIYSTELPEGTQSAKFLINSKREVILDNVLFKKNSILFHMKKKVFRSKYNNSNVKVALKFKETQNYLDSSLLQSSSNNYTDIVNGIDSTFSNEYGTFYIDTSYTQGIGMNNANKVRIMVIKVNIFPWLVVIYLTQKY